MLKKVLMTLAFGMTAAASSAQASSMIGVLACSSVDSGPDHGLNVGVRAIVGPPVADRPRAAHLVAGIDEQTIAGPRPIASYEVTEKQGPGLGAPKYYVGRGFKLELMVDGTPVNGGIRSHVTAEAHGRRVSEELVCHFVR